MLNSRGYYTTQSYFDENHEEIYNRYLSGDYDGIIIHNSDKSADDAVLAIVDNAGQVKSATYSEDLSGSTDNIGTFDRGQKDIRYQQRSYAPTAEELGLSKDIEKENEKLRADASRLRELVRLQSKQTHGKKFTKTSVEAAASRLMKTFGMTRGKSELAQRLNSFYEYIASAEELSWEDIKNRAMEIFKKM